MPAADLLTTSRARVTALARSLHAELIETHISWVLLAGDLAYKLKKPVTLPFVDYSTLEARRHFCEEEVRLNRRLAPGLYLGVRQITGCPARRRSTGPARCWITRCACGASRAGALFSEQLAAGRLHTSDVDALAALLADFHTRANPTANGFASCKRRRAVALAALDGVRAAGQARGAGRAGGMAPDQGRVAGARPWARRARRPAFVRQCHGDLHLDNVISLDGGVAAFDCIEFDPALRWIDIIDDIAFPVMDFAARGRADFAFRLLNAWLDRTGDHAGCRCCASRPSTARWCGPRWRTCGTAGRPRPRGGTWKPRSPGPGRRRAG